MQYHDLHLKLTTNHSTTLDANQLNSAFYDKDKQGILVLRPTQISQGKSDPITIGLIVLTLTASALPVVLQTLYDIYKNSTSEIEVEFEINGQKISVKIPVNNEEYTAIKNKVLKHFQI